MSLSRCCTTAIVSGLVVAVLMGVSRGAARDGDVPDTSKWKVVFADQFDRDKPGDKWATARGEWTIEGGVLKGKLAKGPDNGFDYHDADILLKDVKIPAAVEVRYETWSDDEIGSEAKFLNEAADGGIIMALMGVVHPAYGEKGAMVFVQQQSFNRVGSNKEAGLAAKARHKVRIIRSDDRVTLFLDDKEVLSANVSGASELGELKLHLVGTWGKEGSVVYFDNLEVRVPADAKK